MKNFEKGDKIICVDNTDRIFFLVKNKTYIVTHSYNNNGDYFVNIIDKSCTPYDEHYGIYSKRFISIKEQRKNKLKKIENDK